MQRLSTLGTLFGSTEPRQQGVSHRRLSDAPAVTRYLRSSIVQFFPLIVITQSIVTSAWIIYGMAAVIVRGGDTGPQAA
jgi:hypothetical protein